MVIFRHALLLAASVSDAAQCEAMLKAALEACERYYQAFQFVVWAGKWGAALVSTMSRRGPGMSLRSRRPAAAGRRGQDGRSAARGWLRKASTPHTSSCRIPSLRGAAALIAGHGIETASFDEARGHPARRKAAGRGRDPQSAHAADRPGTVVLSIAAGRRSPVSGELPKGAASCARCRTRRRHRPQHHGGLRKRAASREQALERRLLEAGGQVMWIEDES